jgi:DNA-binding response OmpR family regulator
MLIVAADPTLRFTLEELLGYYGYAVASAASPARAEELIKQGGFNLLLLVYPLAGAADEDHSQHLEVGMHGEPIDWLDWILD